MVSWQTEDCERFVEHSPTSGNILVYRFWGFKRNLKESKKKGVGSCPKRKGGWKKRARGSHREPGNLGHPSADWLGGSHCPWLPPQGRRCIPWGFCRAVLYSFQGSSPYPKIAFYLGQFAQPPRALGDAVSWQVLDILRPSLSHCIRTFLQEFWDSLD